LLIQSLGRILSFLTYFFNIFKELVVLYLISFFPDVLGSAKVISFSVNPNFSGLFFKLFSEALFDLASFP
jgi:hypothetical protein